MEKEFVPYEIALALKKLGFDESCFSYVKHLGYDSSKEKVRILSEVNRSQIEDMGLPLLKIPTFSQAFRWFREKYKLVGLIEIGTQEYSFIIFDEVTDSRKITSSMNGTHEEAEIECLKKLIEIVKTNAL